MNKEVRYSRRLKSGQKINTSLLGTVNIRVKEYQRTGKKEDLQSEARIFPQFNVRKGKKKTCK